MSDLREYKCPACGGAIEFDSKSQKMKCPYCDTEFEPETLKELDAQMEREAGQQDDLSGWQTDAGGEWQEDKGKLQTEKSPERTLEDYSYWLSGIYCAGCFHVALFFFECNPDDPVFRNYSDC